MTNIAQSKTHKKFNASLESENKKQKWKMILTQIMVIQQETQKLIIICNGKT